MQYLLINLSEAAGQLLRCRQYNETVHRKEQYASLINASPWKISTLFRFIKKLEIQWNISHRTQI